VHQRNRTGQLNHFHYLGPNFRFLADATGRGLPETISGKGQFHWITSPMGLLGCLASFQRLMEGVLRDIPNVLVYRDDLLVHTDTHEKHLQVLDQVLARLHKNHFKINLEKCVFGNKEFSYLGFTLTPDGIKPGKNKLKNIKTPKHPLTSRPSGHL
jgi:Reverse transcriptase (RNA-dependent DNA polymerase)